MQGNFDIQPQTLPGKTYNEGVVNILPTQTGIIQIDEPDREGKQPFFDPITREIVYIDPILEGDDIKREAAFPLDKRKLITIAYDGNIVVFKDGIFKLEKGKGQIHHILRESNWDKSSRDGEFNFASYIGRLEEETLALMEILYNAITSENILSLEHLMHSVLNGVPLSSQLHNQYHEWEEAGNFKQCSALINYCILTTIKRLSTLYIDDTDMFQGFVYKNKPWKGTMRRGCKQTYREKSERKALYRQLKISTKNYLKIFPLSIS
ncbi:MAG: hypothetical protein Q9M91_03865 [Candidatus Dojkabacteria bacterium]|nr:hypothetical protein [Candidatus Dojkabacteria bacterium]MDQ7020950.1 hypothetical protein [Candidatus Dojkabacteria bacterium]